MVFGCISAVFVLQKHGYLQSSTIKIQTDLNLIVIDGMNLSEIQHCCSDLFTKLFVSKYVNYQFNEIKYVNHCKQIIDSSLISSLLYETHSILSTFSISDLNDQYSFHQLIALRRYIMIITESIQYQPSQSIMI